MKILLTGSTSFVGRNILEQLRKKYHFLAPSHTELDLTDTQLVRDFFSSHPIDIVIHCAHVGRYGRVHHIQDAVEKNLKMFFNILANKGKFRKVIHFGSGAEYDKSKPIVRVGEEAFGKRIPSDQYGFSKYLCSLYAEYLENIVVLRLFAVYGKYEDYTTRFISDSLSRTALGLPIVINKNAVFDYLYVNDFIKILDFFITHTTKDKSYNVGRGKPIDLLTIARMIQNIANNKSKILINEKGFSNEYTCDNSSLMREMPSFRFTRMEKSLKELYMWYKSIK